MKAVSDIALKTVCGISLDNVVAEILILQQSSKIVVNNFKNELDEKTLVLLKIKGKSIKCLFLDFQYFDNIFNIYFQKS